MIEFGQYLALTKGLCDRTLEHYLGYFRLIDLSSLPHQEYIDAFLQMHNNNSVVRGMMLNLLRFKGLHKTLEIPPAPTGRTKKRIARSISSEEIELLREGLYSQSFMKGLIFELTYQGALRRVEIPTIRINSFQWNDWIKNPNKLCKLIIIGKGDKERTVLINPETAQKILNHYAEKYPDITIASLTNSDQLIFANTHGKPISERIVYWIVKRGSKRFIGRDVRTHELRHCRATELERLGVQIRDIKNYLGHSNLATTEIYLHKSESESLDAIQEKLQK